MSPQRFLQSTKLIGLLVHEKKRKIDFQDLGFPLRNILAIFDLQVSLMLPTKFWVNWPFGSGEEVKNRFSRWPPWRSSWISNRNDFSYFDLQVTPMFPTKLRVNWPFGSGEEAKNRFSRRPPWWPSWVSDRNNWLLHQKAITTPMRKSLDKQYCDTCICQWKLHVYLYLSMKKYIGNIVCLSNKLTVNW